MSFEGESGQVTISLKAGAWFVFVQTERKIESPVHPSTTLVGVDVGVKRFATLSDSTIYLLIDAFRQAEAAVAKAQRALRRKVKISKNWIEARAVV
ncbi:hypothetical protein ASF24_14015 [Methylobacterium sp. Leaf86]|nr:hypothetical protein ASF24_14015 [Methylobacterium sp. Leaf86]